MVKCTGRGLVVKRPGVLSKVQTLDLVLGVGVFSLLPINFARHVIRSERAKGVAKASCGEMVVQKGVFGESVSSLRP